MNANAPASKAVGLLGYGSYLPAHRLDLAEIRATLGSGGGQGRRTIAGYDEDATSMAVEAGRAVLRSAPSMPDVIVLATTNPPYLDKTNATAVHAALALDPAVGAYDAGGAVRSTAGMLRMALRSTGTTLLVASDLRSGRPGSVDESGGGDGAGALLIGDGPGLLAESLATASMSAEFLDRWRAPGDDASRVWEERFGETEYLPLAEAAVTDVLKHGGCTLEEISLAVVTGTHRRAVGRVRASLGTTTTVVDAEAGIGATGAAALPIALAAALDEAEPGQLVLALSLADGADAFLFRATADVQNRPPHRTVRSIADGGRAISYPTYLTWRGRLGREQPRRPEPEAPAGPPAARSGAWKFGFHGSRCVACDTRHLPPQRVCMRCGSVDQMANERLTDVKGTIATFTVDRLAASLHPPVVAAVIDLAGGGRVQLTFRRLHTTASVGVHNYFWKAKPQRGEEVVG